MMKQRKIYVTENDKITLKKLFNSTIGFRSRDIITVKTLLQELERAEITDNKNIDRDIVTMNSTVLLKDLKTKKEYTYQIVYPEKANSAENKISILAPIGTALLGYREGDIIEWEVPAGKRKLQIIKLIYQPEAAANQQVTL